MSFLKPYEAPLLLRVNLTKPWCESQILKMFSLRSKKYSVFIHVFIYENISDIQKSHESRSVSTTAQTKVSQTTLQQLQLVGDVFFSEILNREDFESHSVKSIKDNLQFKMTLHVDHVGLHTLTFMRSDRDTTFGLSASSKQHVSCRLYLLHTHLQTEERQHLLCWQQD